MSHFMIASYVLRTFQQNEACNPNRRPSDVFVAFEAERAGARRVGLSLLTVGCLACLVAFAVSVP